MVDREGQQFAEMSRTDSTIAKMLHQLEVQLARLTCRLGCSREHVLLFHKALLLFYKTYAYLRSDLKFEQKFQVRPCHTLAACCFHATTINSLLSPAAQQVLWSCANALCWILFGIQTG